MSDEPEVEEIDLDDEICEDCGELLEECICDDEEDDEEDE